MVHLRFWRGIVQLPSAVTKLGTSLAQMEVKNLREPGQCQCPFQTCCLVSRALRVNVDLNAMAMCGGDKGAQERMALDIFASDGNDTVVKQLHRQLLKGRELQNADLGR